MFYYVRVWSITWEGNRCYEVLNVKKINSEHLLQILKNYTSGAYEIEIMGYEEDNDEQN